VRPEEIELLSELTIVIPTCNRPLELERSIEYWRDTPVTVHILDGSDKPWFRVGQLPGASNILYHHLPPIIGENWMENYSRRMRIAADLPVTVLSVLCADDDFFTISGLAVAAYAILNSNEIDAVVGICAEYKPNDSDLVWHLRYADWSEGLRSRSNDVAERVLDRSGAFYLYYALMKSDALKSVLYHCYKVAYLHGYAHEHLFNSIAVAHCKVKVLPRIFWVKKVWELNPSIVGQASRVRDADWFRNRENRKEVKIITNHMATAIQSAIEKYGSSISAKKISQKYVARIANFSDTTKFRRLNMIVMGKVVSKSKFLPNFLKKTINLMLPRRVREITGSTPQDPNKHLAKNFFGLTSLFVELFKTDIEFAEEDFTMIEKLLLMPREELRLRADI
jgi:glycosyltransferase domain-containing protein